MGPSATSVFHNKADTGLDVFFTYLEAAHIGTTGLLELLVLNYNSRTCSDDSSPRSHQSRIPLFGSIYFKISEFMCQ